MPRSVRASRAVPRAVRCGFSDGDASFSSKSTALLKPSTAPSAATSGAVSVRGGADIGGLIWPMRAVAVAAAVSMAISSAVAKAAHAGGRTRPALRDCQLNGRDLELIAFRARRRGR